METTYELCIAMKSGKRVFRYLYPSKYESKVILAALCVTIAVLILDTLLNRISDLIINSVQSFSYSSIDILWAIIIVSVIVQYLFLAFTRQKSTRIGSIKRLHFDLLRKIMAIGQGFLSIILLFTVLQVSLQSYYNEYLIVVAMLIAYGLGIAILTMLGLRFFSWFKSSRNSVVLFYGLSASTLALNLIFTAVYVIELLQFSPTEVLPHRLEVPINIVVAATASGSSLEVLNHAYVVSSIVAYIITWIATSILLRHYSKKLGLVIYWIIVSIPFVYFISQFLTLFLDIFVPALKSNPMFYGVLLTSVFTLSKPVGGVLFGVAFWSVSRNIKEMSAVRDYMVIAAIGFVLLFTSNQAIVLVDIPYPPFGLATITFIGLSSYMLLVGVYSSAISVSEDSKLRQSIRNFALKESKLLDSIGTAQMEQEIERRVMTLTRENQERMAEESGIQTSLTDQDMRQYLEQVIDEVKKDKLKRGA